MGIDMSNSHALVGSGRSAQRGILESNTTVVGLETWHPLKIGKDQHENWCSAEQHTEKRLFCRWCRARTGKVVQECTRRTCNVVRPPKTLYKLWRSASRFGSTASFLFRSAVWS